MTLPRQRTRPAPCCAHRVTSSCTPAACFLLCVARSSCMLISPPPAQHETAYRAYKGGVACLCTKYARTPCSPANTRNRLLFCPGAGATVAAFGSRHFSALRSTTYHPGFRGGGGGGRGGGGTNSPAGGGGLAPVACRAGRCLPPRACACPRPPVRGWPSAFPVGNGRESMGRNSASRVTVDCWGLSCPLHEPERHPRPKLAGSPYDYSYHPAYEAVICSSWTGEQRGLPAFWTGRSRCHR